MTHSVIHPTIRVCNFSLTRFGREILREINFELLAGQHWLLTGASGSGKSSLAQALAGELYYRGQLEINYADSALAAKTQYIAPFYHFKDKQGLSEFYYQQRYNSQDAENSLRVNDILQREVAAPASQLNELVELLNFNHRLNTPLIQLSSGERKKIQLIINLLNPVQVMLLDNPYLGLDLAAVRALNGYLAAMAARGTTFILLADSAALPEFITHIAEIKSPHELAVSSRASYEVQQSRGGYAADSTGSSILPKLALVSRDFDIICRLEDVNISYFGKAILRNINWEVRSGEKWLISGPNGVGKSTLLSLINGDNPQSYANTINLFDRRRGSGETVWDIKRNIGYISPELHWNFPAAMSCQDAVCSGFFDTPGLYQAATTEQQQTAASWLTQFGLAQYAQECFATVATGVQRMVLLARALIKNPPLFIFDEPCQGLDEQQNRQFINLIDQLFADQNHTIIYVSHREDQIPRCINQVFTLQIPER